MTEQELESAQEELGQEAEVAPKVPAVSGAKPPSAEPVDTTALVKALVPALRDALVQDEDFIKASQSVKDKRLKVLDDFVPEDFRKFKRYLDKAGGDENEAVRQVLIDKALVNQSKPAEDGQPAVRREQSGESLNGWVSGQLKKFGIAPNDPRYEALVEQFEESPASEAEFKASVRVLISQIRTSEPVPASAVAPSSGTGKASPSNEALKQAYIKEMEANRGKGPLVGREVMAKYRNKGLAVDEIVF
jgi:hypothetical protein